MTIFYDIAANSITQVRVGEGGAIERAATIAPSWAVVTSPVATDLFGIVWTGEAFVAVGASGAVIRSFDDGVTWAAMVSGTANDLFDVASGSPVVIAVGENGTAIHSGNDGIDWAALVTGVSVNLNGITISNAEYVIVGDEMTVLYGEVTSTELVVDVLETLLLTALVPVVIGAFNLSKTQAIGISARATGSPGDFYFDTLAEGLISAEDSSTAGTSLQRDVTEILGFTDHTYEAHALLFERLTLRATTIGGYHRLLSQIISISAALSANQGYSKMLTNTIQIAGTIASNKGYHSPVADSITLTESKAVNQGYAKQVSDSVLLTPAVARNLATTGIAADTLRLTGGVGVLFTLVANAHESINLAAVVLRQGLLRALASEEIVFSGAFSRNGEVFDAWVMNAENRAVSTYQNFGFESMCASESGIFATDGSTIFELIGKDDVGSDIDSWIKTAITDFGTAYTKNCERLYLGIRADGRMLLKTITNETEENWYEVRLVQEGLHEARVKPGKGLKSRYWQFELRNIRGADFNVESMTLVPIRTGRRVSGRSN